VAKGLPDAAAWYLVVGRIFDSSTWDRGLLTLRLRQFAHRHPRAAAYGRRRPRLHDRHSLDG